MARTSSTMRLAIGDEAPAFSLPNQNPLAGEGAVSVDDARGPRGLLVMFMCNHCPFVVHVADEIARLGHDAQAHGIGVVGIMPNDITTHPDDAPEKMADEAEKRGYTFPYLFDESQEIAKAYCAACTPDFFLFDHNLKLVYRGRLDGASPGNDEPVTGRELRAAVHAVAEGQDPLPEQHPSIGCNIKWRAGNEPDYFG